MRQPPFRPTRGPFASVRFPSCHAVRPPCSLQRSHSSSRSQSGSPMPMWLSSPDHGSCDRRMRLSTSASSAQAASSTRSSLCAVSGGASAGWPLTYVAGRALLSVVGFLFFTLPFYAVALVAMSPASRSYGGSDPNEPHAYRPIWWGRLAGPLPVPVGARVCTLCGQPEGAPIHARVDEPEVPDGRSSRGERALSSADRVGHLGQQERRRRSRPSGRQRPAAGRRSATMPRTLTHPITSAVLVLGDDCARKATAWSSGAASVGPRPAPAGS